MAKRIKNHKRLPIKQGRLKKTEIKDEVNNFFSSVLNANKGHNLKFNMFVVPSEQLETYEPIKYRKIELPYLESYWFTVTNDCLSILFQVKGMDKENIHHIHGAPGESYTLAEADGRKLVVTFTEDDCYISDYSILYVSPERLACITVENIESLIRTTKSRMTVTLTGDRQPLVLKHDQFRVKRDVIGSGFSLLLGPEYLNDKEKIYDANDIVTIQIDEPNLKLARTFNSATYFNIS